MLSIYPACFIKEKNGSYSIIYPDLNAATCGNDLEEAFAMAIDCLAGYIYSAEEEGEEIPKASFVADIDGKKVADMLEVSYDEVFVNFVAVNVEEYAKMHFNKNFKEKEGGR